MGNTRYNGKILSSMIIPFYIVFSRSVIDILSIYVSTYSDITSKSTRKGGYYPRYRPFCIIFLSLLLFLFGLAAGLLIGKLVFDKDDDTNGGQSLNVSSTNWGGMVTQDGVQKPVLEAIVDMMKAENIKENLK